MGDGVAYNRPEVGFTPGFGAGQSPWAGMSIGEVLAIIDTMMDGDARGDAAALKQAITDAQTAAAMLDSTFGSGDTLAGQGAEASSTAATSLAGQIRDSLADAQLAQAAMSAGADVLAAAKANAPQLQALQQDVRANPENAAAARAAVDSVMRGTYSNPMNAAQASVALGQVDGNRTPATLLTAGDAATPTAGSPASNTDSGTADSVISTSGAASSGTQGSAAPTPSSTPTLASTSAAEAASVDQPLSLSNSSPTPTSDDADVLDAAGLGNAESRGTAGSSTTGAGMSGALPVAGMAGGVAAGAGGSTTGSPLLRRLPAPGIVGVPAVSPAAPISPGTSRPATPASPMAPHGGQARSSAKDTHKAARYLHTRDNGEELIGEMPLVGPPVIGDWATPVPPPTGGPKIDPTKAGPKADPNTNPTKDDAP